MAEATYAVPSFLGGEISLSAQGRFDKPDYRISLNVCLNSLPVEIGRWTRRPGTQFAGTTRGGGPGRVMKFDFQQASAVTLEFTDGYLRFRNGPVLIPTLDGDTVVSISTATPAVIQTAGSSPWQTGNTVVFGGFGDASPSLLANRQLLITRVDATHFSLRDAISGTAIDGSTIGPLPVNTAAFRVQELATVYTGGAWSGIRAVQAETTAILLSPSIAPQALTVPTLPQNSAGFGAQFALGGAVFNDGPYLDPFTNGVQATPSAKSGIVGLALSFPAYGSTIAYSAGAFVTTGGINYVSLLDQNVGNAPAGGAPWWSTTSAGAAINGGRGFLGSDIGRLVRLFSEPALWAVGTTYAVGAVVAYNPSGLPGATTYWTALAATTTGNIPGQDTTNWTLTPQGAAIWSWGRIVSLTNVIDRALAGSASIGDMTAGGGLAAVFDGTFSKITTSSAEKATSGGGTAAGIVITLGGFAGKNYSGASAQVVSQAVVYPSSDQGISFGTYSILAGPGRPALSVPFAPLITLNLRAKHSAPAFEADGVLLGTSGPIGNTTSPVTVISSDQTAAWEYVWIEEIVSAQIGGTIDAVSYVLTNAIGQISFFNPPGTGAGAGVNVEILGAPLLYTSEVRTWRLGVYSNTTGWPTCGTYHEGRLWLGGAVANRFDASVSNGILGATVNFAPTDQYGAVPTNSAITYTLNSDGVNPMYWMKPDLQGVVIGTQAGEWLVQAPTTGSISPTNIVARRVTKHGSANIEPCRTEHANIFVKRYARKLLEYFADAYSGKFSAPNLADKAEHRVSAGVAEIAYTEAVTPVLWGRDTAGALFGITYKRTTLSTAQGPDFYGWHRHTLGSGRVVESICAGPSAGGDLDTLTMVTNDPATGVRHVELLTDTQGETAPLANSWFLDDAVRPISLGGVGASDEAPYGGVMLGGLSYLNGKTVQVFIGGLDCGDPGEGKTYSDFVVTDSAVFVPYGDGVSAGSGRGLFTADFAAANPPMLVGFTYNSDGQLVRPISMADSGARNGPALGKLRRNHRYAMLLINTLGLRIGTRFNKLDRVDFKLDGAALPALTTFSGVAQGTLQDDSSYDGMMCWRASRPLPANVAAISGNIQTQDQ